MIQACIYGQYYLLATFNWLIINDLIYNGLVGFIIL